MNLDGLLSFAWIWPIVLLVIGALFLVSALTRPRLEGDVMEWDCC